MEARTVTTLSPADVQTPWGGSPPRRMRALMVGGLSARRCSVAGSLEPRGYDIERTPEPPTDLAGETFDVVIFALPCGRDEAVVEACERLREAGGPAILVLHEGCDPGFAIRALEAGADDCIAAPHNPREVVARVRALLRRRARSVGRYGGRHYVFDGCQLDSVNLLVRAADGREVEITPAQHRLLTVLLERPGEVVSRERLLDAVLGEASDAFDRAIDVHVSRLKKRLARVTDIDLITCYRGVGYRLEVQQVTQ